MARPTPYAGVVATSSSDGSRAPLDSISIADLIAPQLEHLQPQVLQCASYPGGIVVAAGQQGTWLERRGSDPDDEPDPAAAG